MGFLKNPKKNFQIPDGKLLKASLLSQDQFSTLSASEIQDINYDSLLETDDSIRSIDQKPTPAYASIQQSLEEDNQKKKDQKKFSWPIYKKLLSFTMKRWKLFLVSFTLTIVFAAIVSLVPYKIGSILDSITRVKKDSEQQMNLEELNYETLTLLVIILASGVTTYIRYTASQYLQQRLAIDMKLDIYSTFIKYDVYFFQKYKTGELVSRLGTDINQAKSAVSNNLTLMIRNVVLIIFNITILLIMSWKLTLAVMTVIPFYVLVTVYYNRNCKPLIVEYQNVLAQQASHVSEKFGAIQLIKAYSTENREIDNYNSINLKSFDVAKKRIFVMAVYMTASKILPLIGVLIVLWYGGKLSIDGNAQFTPGQLTSFILYCQQLATNTQDMSNNYANIITGTSAVTKVFEMLGYVPKVSDDTGQANVELSGEVTFQNVKFNYPGSKVQIFRDLSFKIKKGEYVGFVGQSGSGKSTIIKLIERFYKIEQGRIMFGDTDSEEINMRQARQQIGMVNQQATIFSGTIEENITYGLVDGYSQKELLEASERSGCLQFIQNGQLFPYGFQTMLGEKGSNLSGGQRQRISIARALIRKPKMIIFDEATSALDANSETMVQESIERLATTEQNKITIIVIAHRLSTIINADRIMVMKEGELLEQGTHQQLKQKRGYYYELVQNQLQEDCTDCQECEKNAQDKYQEKLKRIRQKNNREEV